MKKLILLILIFVGCADLIKDSIKNHPKKDLKLNTCIVVAKEKNPNPSNHGSCTKGTFTTVKRIDSGLRYILCGNWGNVGDTITIRY